MTRTIDQGVIDKRNALIIKSVNDGVSVSKIGLVFGITRERVCQIFFKSFGKSVRQVRLEEKLKQMELERLLSKKTCVVCGREFTNQRRKYCSNACYDKHVSRRKRDDITIICDGCGTAFHPWYTSKYKKMKHHFCTHKCYVKSKYFGRI
jgi:hypothetical protein